MSFDIERLRKLAKTIRLEIEIGEEEILLEKIQNEFIALDAILEVDTSGIEPLINPNKPQITMFTDEVSDGDEVDELMSCATQSLYNYYVVPKVIK